MIKHIVAWRFKDEALGASKSENLARAKAALESLSETVPSVEHLEVGLDVGAGNDTWDIVIYSEFADRAALDAYQVHPEHVKAAQLIGEMREARSCVDYEV